MFEESDIVCFVDDKFKQKIPNLGHFELRFVEQKHLKDEEYSEILKNGGYFYSCFLIFEGNDLFRVVNIENQKYFYCKVNDLQYCVPSLEHMGYDELMNTNSIFNNMYVG